MDPPLDPPLRMTFLHPGRTLTLSEAQDNITAFLTQRSERLAQADAGSGVTSAGGAAGAEDAVGAPVARLAEALKEEARVREGEEGMVKDEE